MDKNVELILFAASLTRIFKTRKEKNALSRKNCRYFLNRKENQFFRM